MNRQSVTRHRPVLLRETLQGLALEPGLKVVDGTVGAAGHSSEIWARIQPGGLLLGLDRDEGMLERARNRLCQNQPEQELPAGVTLLQSSYADLSERLETLEWETVDRILVDLGLSSDQLADRQRGFGFSTTGPLDMRFDASQGEPVSEWLHKAEVADLTKILTDFGEEPFAAEIAQAIVEQRSKQKLTDAQQLTRLVESVYARRGRKQEKSHPATRTFQALRIHVNAELEHLQRFLTITAPQSLPQGGRLAVITFHSLEDRLVKQALANRDIWEESSRKPVIASALEIKMNPRSRSAKLRIGIRAHGEIDHISHDREN